MTSRNWLGASSSIASSLLKRRVPWMSSWEILPASLPMSGLAWGGKYCTRAGSLVPGRLDYQAYFIPDSAAVLDGHRDLRINHQGSPQVGVGGQVAQDGLFGTHEATSAVEEHVGLSEYIAVQLFQYALQRFGYPGYFGNGRACKLLSALRVGGVGSAQVRVDRVLKDTGKGSLLVSRGRVGALAEKRGGRKVWDDGRQGM